MAQDKLELYNRLDADSAQILGILGSMSENSEKIDRILSKNVDLISKATSAMEKSMSFVTKDFNAAFKGLNSYAARSARAELELSKAKQDIDDIIHELKIGIDNATDDNDKRLKMLALNEAEAHKLKLSNIKEGRALQVKAINEIRNSALNLITKVADEFISVFTKGFSQAYNTVTSVYESTYGKTTSYNSYSRQDYNMIVNNLQKFIKENRLSESVSITDFQQEIVSILEGGLVGDLATTVAKYSVLSKEGGISADFSDVDTLKMLKRMEEEGGDVEAYLEQIMIQSKSVIQSVGDSFGFANGQINTMMSSLYNMAEATGMTQEAISKSTTAMTAFNGVLGSTNLDASKVYETLSDYVNNGLTSSNKETILTLQGLVGGDLEEQLRTGNMEDVLSTAIGGIYDKYAQNRDNVEFTSELNKALNSTYSVEEIKSLLNKYGTKEDFQAAFEEAIAAAEGANTNEYLANLREYQTVQESFDNVMQNGVTDLVQASQDSNILVKTGFDTVVAAISNLNLTTLINGATNLSNITGLGGKFADIGAARSLYSDGFKFRDVVTTTGSKGIAALGKAAQVAPGVGLMIAGLAMGADSGIDAASAARIRGESGVAQFGYGAAGFATGHTFGLSNRDKLAKAELKKESLFNLDWGEVGKSTAAGGLLGAGIGTAAGGWAMGAGTAIGAGVGAAVGAITNITSQAIDMHEANELVESEFYNLAGSLSEISDNIGSYSDSIKEYASTYMSIQDKQNKLTDENNTLSKEEIANLEKEIEYEKTHLEYLAKKAQKESEGIGAQMENAAEDFKQNADLMSAIDKVKAYYREHEDEVDKLDFGDKATKDSNIKKHLDSIGLTKDEIAAVYAQGGITKDNASMYLKDNGELTSTGAARILLQGISGNRSGHNFANEGSYSFESLSDDTIYNTAASNYQAAHNVMSQILDLENNVGLAFAAVDTNNSNYDFSLQRSTIEAYLRGLAAEDSAYGLDSSRSIMGNSVQEMLSTKFKVSKTAADLYSTWLQDNGIGTDKYAGYYKVGIPYVPYDNFPALLHKGEKVMTATEAALEHSKGPQITEMNSTFASAIASQTQVLVASLDRIYKAIVNTSSPKSSLDSTSNLVLSGYKLPGIAY